MKALTILMIWTFFVLIIGAISVIVMNRAFIMNRKKGKRMKKQFDIGDRIRCKNWKDTKNTALKLASLGYGVAVLGFSDMANNVLTITALPERKETE